MYLDWLTELIVDLPHACTVSTISSAKFCNRYCGVLSLYSLQVVYHVMTLKRGTMIVHYIQCKYRKVWMLNRAYSDYNVIQSENRSKSKSVDFILIVAILCTLYHNNYRNLPLILFTSWSLDLSNKRICTFITTFKTCIYCNQHPCSKYYN